MQAQHIAPTTSSSMKDLNINTSNCSLITKDSVTQDGKIPGSKVDLKLPSANVQSKSLTSMMRKRRQRRGSTICFATVDYGYGDESFQPEQHAVKKRRFNRRNSKTPQMLMQQQSLLPLSLIECSPSGEDFDLKDDSSEDGEKCNSELESRSDKAWGNVLVVAEEIVKQLKKRRNSASSNASRDDQLRSNAV